MKQFYVVEFEVEDKARRKGDYMPSRSSYKFGVTGCSLWK